MMDRRLCNICSASLVLLLISFDGCLSRPWWRYRNEPVDGEEKEQGGVVWQQLKRFKWNMESEEMEREFQKSDKRREERMSPGGLRIESKRNERKLEDGREVLRRQRIDAFTFLQRFGYLPALVENASYDPASVISAIKDMQRMYHLNMTGELDEMTIKMMQMPRCGVRDDIRKGYLNVSRSRSRSATDPETEQIANNFVVSGRGWRKKEVKWNLKNYHELLSPEVTKKALRQAFKYWSDVTPLTFTETERKADINMKFVAGLHEDGPINAFDGPGGIIAHAFYPEDGGEAHFDEEEDWTDGKVDGLNLMIVATHEIGHSLGLAHSDVPGAVMAPSYGGYDPNFKLSDDDVQGIQSLYGGPTQRTQPPTPAFLVANAKRTSVKPTAAVATTKRPTTQALNPNPPSDGQPNTCDMIYRAITQAQDYRIYIFNGRWMWRTSDYGLDQGFPQTISTYYESPPEDITAAIFSLKTYYTYLFKGKTVWKYSGFQLIDTKTIENPGYPESPKVAVTFWDDTILLVKDGNAWEFDEELFDVRDTSNPIPFDSFFPDAPATFDSAVRLLADPRNIYFFKGSKYYKYNEFGRIIVEGYPKEKAGPWMGPACGAKPYTPK